MIVMKKALARRTFLRGAGTMIALPGLIFIAVTVLTLCAPPVREIYGRRMTTAAVPSPPGAAPRRWA